MELPGPEELFLLLRDARGTPCGVKPADEAVAAAAREADPELVLAALDSGDPGLALSAIVVALRLAVADPRLAPRTEKALLRLCADQRLHEAVIEDAAQVFDLAGCAFRAYFELLRRRPPDLIAILAVLGSTLLHPRRTDLTAAAVREFNAIFKGHPRHQPAAEEVAELLADAVVDAQLSPSTRIRAYEAIVSGCAFGPAYRRVDPAAKAAFEPQRLRAAQALVQALEEKGAKPDLQEYVLLNLHAIAPDAIGPLQDKGVLKTEGLPPLAALLEPEGVLGPAKAAAAALSLRHEDVRAALASGSEEAAGLLPAILLAPFMARRGDWHPLAGDLRKRIASTREIKARLKAKTATFDLGREAASSLLSLLRLVSEDAGREAVDWLLAGLDECLARGMTPSGSARAPVMDYLQELLAREHETGGRLKKAMDNYLRQPGRPPQARLTAFAHYRLLDPAADDLARAVLADPKEDPEFLSLLRPLVPPPPSAPAA